MINVVLKFQSEATTVASWTFYFVDPNFMSVNVPEYVIFEKVNVRTLIKLIILQTKYSRTLEPIAFKFFIGKILIGIIT